MTTMVEITCRDPIVSRDGRPFGANSGNRMKSVGWPLPSVVAGSLRTLLGKRAGRDFTKEVAEELLTVEVAGALTIVDETLYLPAPHDCVVHPEKGALRVSPVPTEGYCNWPDQGLEPVMLTEKQAEADFKPGDSPAWWPLDSYVDWLVGNELILDSRFLAAPTPELRTHVQLLPETGSAEEGRLFTTSALPLSHLRRFGAGAQEDLAKRFAAIALAARATASGWMSDVLKGLDTLHTLGGERRLVHWAEKSGVSWACPDRIKELLETTDRIRMILATPAIFSQGWKPGWLGTGLSGKPPGSETALKLVGVCIPRWRAVSGWSLAVPSGPKPVRRMVPAGGVYFFEVQGGSAAELLSGWLRPVSDLEQDRRDGFGLAVWGTW